MRKRFLGAVSGVVAALVVALPVFAVEVGQLDWSADLTTNVAGITAGVIASIAAVFGIAVLVRLTFRAARIGLKALNFIK
jgi:hypothetical protein